MNPLQTKYFNFGTLLGIMLYVFFLLFLYLFNLNPLGNIKWVSSIVQYTLIFWIVRSIRDQFYNQNFTLRQAFSSSMYLVLISSTLFCALMYLQGVLIDDLFVVKYIEQIKFSIDEMRRMGYFTSLIEAAEASIHDINLQQIVFGEFFNKFFGGFIFSFVLAFILRKQTIIHNHE